LAAWWGWWRWRRRRRRRRRKKSRRSRRSSGRTGSRRIHGGWWWRTERSAAAVLVVPAVVPSRCRSCGLVQLVCTPPLLVAPTFFTAGGVVDVASWGTGTPAMRIFQSG
jgi:hypothetical protein